MTGEFSLSPPSVPKFSVDWYARGGVFDKPTLFTSGGRLGGLGEAGAEAIVPLENNTQWLDKIADRLSDKLGGGRNIVLQVDGKTFGQIRVDSINALTKQTGNYNAQTNAAGNTLVDLINSKRSIEATIIPLDSATMATLQEALNSFKCQISFLNPQTKQLTTIDTIVSDVKVEYYTIQASKTLYKAFTITFKEL